MLPDMKELEAFIAEKRDSREYRRALAVKMALNGFEYDVICDILSVTPGFISQAKKAYLEASVQVPPMSYSHDRASTPDLTLRR